MRSRLGGSRLLLLSICASLPVSGFAAQGGDHAAPVAQVTLALVIVLAAAKLSETCRGDPVSSRARPGAAARLYLCILGLHPATTAGASKENTCLCRP